MNRATVVACVVAPLVAGCAARGTVRKLAEDLKTVQSEVGALRQSQEDLSRRLAENASANRAANAKSAEVQASIVALKADVERVTAKLQATDGALKAVNEALARDAAAAPPSTPRVAEPAQPGRSSSAESAFAAGLSNFRNREYGQAVLDFLDVVTKHPTHELAATSQFWIGEAYYLQLEYRQALIEFERAVEWASPHPKLADALLRAGLCHNQLRESMRAQQAWRRVVREFPESSAADEARLLLEGKKAPARRP